jgi:hypothetical protein
VKTEDGRPVTLGRCRARLGETLARLEAEGLPGRFREAAGLLDQLISAPEFPEFLTLAGYAYLK